MAHVSLYFENRSLYARSGYVELSFWAIIRELEFHTIPPDWLNCMKDDLKLKDLSWESTTFDAYLIDAHRINTFLKILKEVRRRLKKEKFFPLNAIFNYPLSIFGHSYNEPFSTKNTISYLGYLEQLIKGHKFLNELHFGYSSRSVKVITDSIKNKC